MGCVYNYKGKLFNSELELDDFLLDRKDLLNKYSDIIFNRTPQLNTKRILDERYIPLEVLRKQEKSDTTQAKALQSALLDNPNTGVYQNYIGVTEFLSHFTTGENKLLFPEFRENEYWAVRKKYWSSYRGENVNEYFTPEEIEAIFGNNEAHALVTDEEVNKAIETITKKWIKMADIGTEIHRVMQDYFGQTSGGTPIRNLDKGFLLNTYFADKVNSDLIPPTALADILTRCEELKEFIYKEFGSDVIFMPELVIKGQTNQSKNNNEFDTLIGIVDLAVIDNNGNVHIFDYKTSPIPYNSNKSSIVKTHTYQYQLATYNRIIEKYGIDTEDSRLFVVPLELTNFTPDENGNYTYDGVKAIGDGIIASDLTSEIKGNSNINKNLDEFLPKPIVTNVSTENMLQYVTNNLRKWIPQYENNEKDLNKRATDLVKNVEMDPNSGKFKYRMYGMREPITADSKEDLIIKVKSELKDQMLNNHSRVDKVIDTLKQAIKEGDMHPQFKLSGKYTKDPQGDAEWFDKSFSQYCNGNWKVLDCDQAKELGIILLLNTNGLVDVVKISSNNLNRKYKLTKGNTIFGNFLNDSTAYNMPKSTVLEATQGNIELMETMLVLNNLKGLFSDQASFIGQIKVMNPRMQEGNPADNSVLMYNFKQLTRLSPIEEIKNNFADGSIKMVTWVDRAYYEFKEIMAFTSTMPRQKTQLWNSFVSCKNGLEKNINDPEGLKTSLTTLRQQLLDKFPSLKLRQYDKYNNEPEYRLYEMVTTALGELNGITFYQLQDKRNDWMDKLDITKHGLHGLRLDNPGNTSSKFLNEATDIVKSAYQNIRSDLNRYIGNIEALTNDLKREKGIGYLAERTVYNQVDLYKDMFDTTYNDDLVLKNPWDPNTDLYLDSQKEFLKYFLRTVNKNRYASDFVGMSDAEIDETIQSSIKYLRVPLTFGGTDSVVSLKGLIPALKDKLSALSPKNIVRRTQETIDGFLSDEERNAITKHGQLWEMQNRFDRGESESRLDDISKLGIERFERNLETVLLKHLYAYSEKEHINKVLPSLEAMAMYLARQGNEKNTKYEAEIKYLEDYVKNKVFNQPIMDERSQMIQAYLGEIMGLASKLALGLSPTQLYQRLNGVWVDIGFMYTNPDGSNAFSVENMRDSYFFVAKDFIHYGNKRSLSEALNDYYGLNDRDMNVYVNRVKSGQYNFWNMNSFLFRMASRPDYYNRLTIFGARMRADGCWEAHSLDENGNLKYDWSRDARYNLVAKEGLNSSNKDPEYIKQRQRYLAVSKQLIAEGTKNNDGTLFKVGDALPKAYTNQESSSYKDEIDWKYGFYSHESKSLMQSSLIGGLMLQMYTYWSGKKNQYFAESGIKQRGRMEQLKIEGKLQWMELDENGEATGNFTETNTGVPYMIWQGQFQEGIVLTLRKTAEAIWFGGLSEGDFQKGWDYYVDNIWNNEDDNLRNAYRANLKQFSYDMSMFLILGELFGDMLVRASMEYQRRNKNKTFEDAVTNTLFSLSSKMFKQSVSDFNFFDSFAGRLTSWNPFALSTMTNLYNSYSRAIFGVDRLYDAFVNTTTATRTMRPIFEFINPKEDE